MRLQLALRCAITGNSAGNGAITEESRRRGGDGGIRRRERRSAALTFGTVMDGKRITPVDGPHREIA